MCYLIAKGVKKRGCFALKTIHGKHLVQPKHSLNAAVRARSIQIVTISRPNAYGEYAPYIFAKNETEFWKMVMEM